MKRFTEDHSPLVTVNEILVGDSLTLLKAIPDESVDVVFADPPFNLRKPYRSVRDALADEAYMEWARAWLVESVRVLKPTGSLFVHNIPKWLMAFSVILNEIADFRHWIVWAARSSPRGKTLQPWHYGFLYYAKDKRRNKFYEIRQPHARCRRCKVVLRDYGGKRKRIHPFGPLVSDVWTDIARIQKPTVGGRRVDRRLPDGSILPNALPTPLLERILLMSTDEGDLVLDIFLGTGTTAVAAKRLGRCFLGFEIDETYAAFAKHRVEAEKDLSRLGRAWVSYRGGVIPSCTRSASVALSPTASSSVSSDEIASVYVKAGRIHPRSRPHRRLYPVDTILTIRDRDWEEIEGYFIVPEAVEAINEYPAIFWRPCL